jgi:hypothetical protein
MDQLFPKGNKFSAVFVTFKRDLVFSSIYWVIIENIRQTLLNENKNNLISSNIISASIGGCIL